MELTPKSRQIFYSFSPLLNLYSLGLVYGYPAVLIPSLKDKESNIQANLETISWIVAVPGIFAIIINILVGPMMNMLGRKKTNYFISVCGLIGWILVASSTSVYTLLLSRAFHGILKGSNIFCSMCVAEFTSPALRGLILPGEMLFIALGTATSHVIGIFVHWRYLALIGVISSAIALVINVFWTETPAWLILKHKFSEAEEVFYKLRNKSKESDAEIKKMIVKEQRRVSDAKNIKIIKMITSKSFWTVAALGTAVQITLECGGRHYFPAFLIELVKNLTGDKSYVFLYVMILDFISVIASIASCIVVKKFSRRSLILKSGLSCVFFLVAFCTLLFLYENYFPLTFLYVLFLIFFGLYFVTVFGATFTAVCTLNGEIWPLEFRHIGIIYQGLVASVVFTIVMKSIPFLSLNLHIYGMFSLSALILTLTFALFYKYLPETHEKTLHEIGEHFDGNIEVPRTNEEMQDFMKK